MCSEVAPVMARELERAGGRPSGDVHEDARALYDLYKQDRVEETAIVSAITFCYAGGSAAELRALGRRIVDERLAGARYDGIEPVARGLVERGLSLVVVSGSPKLLVEEGVRGWLPLVPERDVIGI